MAFGSAERHVVADIPVHQPAYMHSFGMSENHLVLVEFPFITNPIRLLLSGRPFIETYRWRPERGLTFTVVAKDTGAIVKCAATDACFGFHIINSFERDGSVVIDLIAYEDSAIVNNFYLEQLRSGGGAVTGALTRFTIPLGQGSVEREILSSSTLELPAFDYRGLAGQPYRYLWSAGQVADGFMNRLQKFDLSTGVAAFWSEAGCYPGEPIFVPAPDAEAQDQGVILSIVLDAARQRSFLLVLDAATLEEQARAWTPHVIPFGFHGTHRAERDSDAALAVAAE
jgi:carotenoid cleavage dioxygenase-like enzyme